MRITAPVPAVEIGARDPETGRVPVRLPKPRVNDPGFFGGLLAEWQAEEAAKADAPAPTDPALDALMRAAAATLAPHSRDRFDLLRGMGATPAELAAVFGLPVPSRAEGDAR